LINDVRGASGASGGNSIKKFAANKCAIVWNVLNWGPHFGGALEISDRCNENHESYCRLDREIDGFGSVGCGREAREILPFGSENFRVSEYEVFQLEVEWR
jgi:hypothetical protein